jgi:hypothetical protein
MEVRKRKTLGDFPKFVVPEVRRGATSETGYTSFELEGSFDRILPSSFDHVVEGTGPRDVSIVGGREVRVWTKLEPTGENRGQSRHYPATDQTLPVRSGIRLVPSGWGHEHCELCKEHIDAGIFGYCDPGGRWMCEKCYERYVVPRDLAFVDEL